MLAGTNDAIAREERVEAVEELKTLVEDWKGHRIEGFGELLLHGQFTVLKGDSMSSKNEEREVGYLQNTQIFYLTYILVQNLLIRNDIALLQRDQCQQAEEQDVHEVISYQRRKAKIAAERPHFHAKRYRDDFAAEAWILHMSDLLERRSRHRELHHSIYIRGNHEEMGGPSGRSETGVEGPGTLKRQYNRLEAVRY